MWQICPSVPEIPPSGGNPIRTHTHQVIEMSSANSFNGPQKLSPSEVTRILSGMSPLQATRYYNKCMTNPNTPVENVNLLMQFRAQNPNKFLSEDQMKGSRRSKGSWMSGKGYSGGWKDRSNGRVYSQGYSYDAYGRAYDPSGNEVGGWHDGGADPNYGFVTGDQYVRGGGSGGMFMRRQKPISQVRSIAEIGETLKGFNDPIRGRFYIEKIINNPSSNPETVKNAMHFLEVGSTFIASDEQIAQYRASHPNVGGQRQGFLKRFFQKPIDQARSPQEIANTVTHLKSNVARTRYYDKVIGNPNSNVETIDNLIAFKEANPHLFASPEEVQAAPHDDSFRSRFWKSKEEFDAMSPRKKMFFVGAVNRKSRQKNCAYGLRVTTDPETSPADKQAFTEVVNENPGLFFRNPKPSRKQSAE
jgi:hypothetical protein